MQRYEYRVVPAPAQAGRVKGLKTAADRFAHGLAEVMNGLGREGWEYLRAESLPCEDRPGMLSRPVTSTLHLLVFRRPLVEPAMAAAVTPARVEAAAPQAPLAAPAAAAPLPAEVAVAAAPAPAAPHGTVRLMPLPHRPGGPRGGPPRLGAATGRGLFRGPASRPDDGEGPDGHTS